MELKGTMFREDLQALAQARAGDAAANGEKPVEDLTKELIFSGAARCCAHGRTEETTLIHCYNCTAPGELVRYPLVQMTDRKPDALRKRFPADLVPHGIVDLRSLRAVSLGKNLGADVHERLDNPEGLLTREDLEIGRHGGGSDGQVPGKRDDEPDTCGAGRSNVIARWECSGIVQVVTPRP